MPTESNAIVQIFELALFFEIFEISTFPKNNPKKLQSQLFFDWNETGKTYSYQC